MTKNSRAVIHLPFSEKSSLRPSLLAFTDNKNEDREVVYKINSGEISEPQISKGDLVVCGDSEIMNPILLSESSALTVYVCVSDERMITAEKVTLAPTNPIGMKYSNWIQFWDYCSSPGVMASCCYNVKIERICRIITEMSYSFNLLMTNKDYRNIAHKAEMRIRHGSVAGIDKATAFWYFNDMISANYLGEKAANIIRDHVPVNAAILSKCNVEI